KASRRAAASGTVPGAGVRIQGRPSNRSARAFAAPPFAAPAIGWPPMKFSDGRLAAAAHIARFVLPVSVTRVAALTCSSIASSSRMFARTGAARTTRSTPATFETSSPASSAATSTRGHARSVASRIDAPIRPLPTMATRPNGGSVLDTPAPARHGLQADAAADRRPDDPQLRHQAIELRRQQRLRAVAERVVGIVVHLDDEAVGAGRDGGARHRRHLVAASRSMARIADHGQVAELLDDGDGGDVERIA